MLKFIRDILRLLLNIEHPHHQQPEMSFFSRLITDIILIISLFIFTFFAILGTTQETFKTHVKFQNQRKNLPNKIVKKLEHNNAVISWMDEDEKKEDDHWGDYVCIFHCFGPRMMRKLVRRKHKKVWSKTDIDVFYDFYIMRYLYPFFYASLLVQILKVMKMRALYQHLPIYVVYLVGTAAFLSSKANLCYYIREDIIFDWYVSGGGGSFAYSCFCFVIFQEILGVFFKKGVLWLLG